MATLISVNVGLPRMIEWNGRSVLSAIWKTPQRGPVQARRLGLEGDGVADMLGHGGEVRAVLVYQLSSYEHWNRFLNREEFEYGQFGENLTVDGLADDEVCIGDRYRIGQALFEVSQPRVTCFKVGIRMRSPELPGLLVAHGRPGFYMRVIQEGEICAGDEIVKVSAGEEQMTVTEIDALLYKEAHPAARLAKALRIPALSPGWKGSFQELLKAEHDGAVSGNAGLTSTPDGRFGSGTPTSQAGLEVQAPHLPAGAAGQGPNVTFVRSGLAVRWSDRFPSLLALAEACDVPTRWSCRSGVCHRCQAHLLDGQVTYGPEPLSPPTAGTILLCCARPQGDIQLDL